MPTYSGRSGFFQVDGVLMPAVTWSISSEVELEDYSNTATGRFVANLPNLQSFTIQANGYWAGSIGLVIGSLHTLRLGVFSGMASYAVTARIKSFTLSQDVKGAARFELTATSEGPFTTVF